MGLGLDDTVLRRAYYRDDWLSEVGGNADFDPLPAIRLDEAGRESQIPARTDTASDAATCRMSSCTSLEDTTFFYDPRDRRVAWAVTAQIPSADRNDIARLGACLGGLLEQL